MNSIRATILKSLNRRRYSALADALDSAVTWAHQNLPYKQMVDLHAAIEEELADTCLNRDEAVETLARTLATARYRTGADAEASTRVAHPGISDHDWNAITARADQIMRGLDAASPASPTEAGDRLRRDAGRNP